MSLNIETYTNADPGGGWRPGNNAGGHSLFKALGHPLAAPGGRELIQRLAAAGPLAVFDPLAQAAGFAALHDLAGLDIAEVFVDRPEHLDGAILGRAPAPVTGLTRSSARSLFIAAFDARAYQRQVAPFLPAGMTVFSLDHMRIPDAMLSNPERYLDPINFATNFAFLRDAAGQHSQVAGANYWSAYGARHPALWLRLYDGDGAVLAEWTEDLNGANATYAIDSRQVRTRFKLGDFAGTLFIHAVNVAGHDVVKYALDTFSDDFTQVSCSHDANAWPADLYAGMAAPEPDEQLLLWVQNSHPVPIPAGAIGFNLVGSQDTARYRNEVPPFGTHGIDMGRLLPAARWPDQIEIQAGRHFVRPRYEVIHRASGRRRIAHANVERTDLEPNPELATLAPHFGKGYILPLPVLPLDRFHGVALPTPMATTQRELPLGVELFDADGTRVATRYPGRVPRRHSVVVDVDQWLAEADRTLPSGSGHVEFRYDFRDGGEADGWLHALGRYELRSTGHRAETIFGAHMYNIPMVYGDEPQAYAGPPPGLTTRLFLRLGPARVDTFCHLIYPASLPWHANSSTELNLFDAKARLVAAKQVKIPCGGSLHWRYHDIFDADERADAGVGAYVQIRDATCRLFGFHGLLNGETSFSLDHMFGF